MVLQNLEEAMVHIMADNRKKGIKRYRQVGIEEDIPMSEKPIR